MANHDLVGQQMGSYRLVSLLAVGAFAEVYLGEHIHLRTKAAIKVLRTQLSKDQVELFRKEARTIASLVHPNIVRVLDFGVAGQTPFLILEYAPNGTLAHLYRKVAVPPTTILPLVKQVASALQYAHNRGFIHGQVMPSNMLLGHNNEVLLDHFRFSLTDNDVEPWQGTPLYIAPEQLHGQLLPASDQYALGVTVYEWLSGHKPFSGHSSMAILMQHVKAEPPSLHTLMPTISPDVEQVVMKALAKDPQQRFPSVEDFAAAFEQAYQHKYYPYDVALSYAGEDRNYADALADILHQRGVNVFYDKYEKAVLWGEDLYTYLSDLYQNKARYCVLFISKHYALKVWTKHELRAAQARALNEQNVYILPVRLDNTEIPGLLPTIAYLDWHQETIDRHDRIDAPLRYNNYRRIPHRSWRDFPMLPKASATPCFP